jgi:HEAT repeat protein
MRRFYACLLVAALFAAVSLGCATTRNSAETLSRKVQLAAEGDQGAVKALIETLRGGERAQRDEAYRGLIGAGQSAVPQLIATLDDKDPDMREYAAAALGDIGDQRAVKPLLAILKGAGQRRYIAAWALGKLKAEEAIDPLIASLAEKNDALQKESTRALIGIGGPAVPALIAALDDPRPDVRKFASRALGIIEDKRAEAPLIKRLDDQSEDVAAAAALALGTAGTNSAVGPLVKALKADYILTKVNAEISLGTLEAKQAVEPLTAIMENDPDPYVREWSARALENITGNRYKYKDENGVMVYPYNLYR